MALIAHGKWKLSYKMVVDLALDIEGKGHIIVMDKFFTNIGPFKDLLVNDIYATRSMWSNWVGIPNKYKDTKVFNREMN